MQKLIGILLFISFISSSYGQNETAPKPGYVNSYLKERAEKNLSLLVKGSTIRKSVKIDDKGIHFTDTYGKNNYSFYWPEMAHVITVLETQPYYEMLRFLEHKGTQHVSKTTQTDFPHYREYPTDMSELYVAIDPGHFGGDLEEAKLEGRLMKVAASDVGQSGAREDVKFFESHLTYTTSLLIKSKIEALGGHCMITRPYGAGAMGLGFGEWLQKQFKKDVSGSLKRSDISKTYHDELVLAYSDTVRVPNRHTLFNFYKFLDFRARAAKINEFHPNITLVIHFNAADDNKPYGDKYYKPVADNYNMMFVPGAFMDGELLKTDQKLDFIRLLLSQDLDNSQTLADYILDEHQSILGVGRSYEDTKTKIGQVSNLTDYPGIYARNLYLTRAVKGTVVYGESLVQDNVNEVILLSAKDVTVMDGQEGSLKTSKRCDQVAEAYKNGVVRFLEANKKKKEAYSASVSETGSDK